MRIGRASRDPNNKSGRASRVAPTPAGSIRQVTVAVSSVPVVMCRPPTLQRSDGRGFEPKGNWTMPLSTKRWRASGACPLSAARSSLFWGRPARRCRRKDSAWTACRRPGMNAVGKVLGRLEQGVVVGRLEFRSWRTSPDPQARRHDGAVPVPCGLTRASSTMQSENVRVEQHPARIRAAVHDYSDGELLCVGLWTLPLWRIRRVFAARRTLDLSGGLRWTENAEKVFTPSKVRSM